MPFVIIGIICLLASAATYIAFGWSYKNDFTGVLTTLLSAFMLLFFLGGLIMVIAGILLHYQF